MNKFLKISTWQEIIKSRKVYNQNKNKEWYKDRKSICNSCPFNSKFKKNKTFKEKLLSIFYLGRDYCSVCFCPTKFLCALEENTCSAEDIGEKPKWESQWK